MTTNQVQTLKYVKKKTSSLSYSGKSRLVSQMSRTTYLRIP